MKRDNLLASDASRMPPRTRSADAGVFCAKLVCEDAIIPAMIIKQADIAAGKSKRLKDIYTRFYCSDKADINCHIQPGRVLFWPNYASSGLFADIG